jgi:hypothetical protein
MATPTPRAANTIGGSGNSPPVLAPIGNKSGNEGAPMIFAAAATDPNSAQTLTYSLDPGSPSGAAINSNSGVFTWTPAETQGPGVFSITVRVTDNGSPSLNDFETISVTINEVNVAPSLAFISDKTVNEGSVLSFTASATDSDVPAQALSFSVDLGAPSGVIINPTNGFFTWTPAEAQGPGIYSVTVRVADNGSPAQSTAETFNITVNEVNTAPLLAAIGNQSVNEGVTLTFISTATDPDIPANTLTFSLDPGAPVGAVIDPASGVFTWTPSTNQAPSTNAVTVRVTDNGSPASSDSGTFTIIASTITPLRVTAVSVSGANVVTLDWSSQAGKTYRVEFKDNLGQTTWNTLGDFNATESTMSATDSISGTPQRFYRIQQMN